MTNNDDLGDFVVFWEFFNPFEDEDKAVTCPVCGKEFDELDRIEVVDKEDKIFRCPDCGKNLQFDPAQEELIEAEKEEAEKKEPQPQKKESLIFPVGSLKSPEKFVCRVRDGKAAFYLDLITLEIKARRKNDIIKEMVGLFTASGIVKDGQAFYERLVWRESLGSTGIGLGVAIPYAYVDLAIEEEIVTAVVIIKEGVDFDSLDGESTRLIFMSANRQYGQTEPAMPHLHHLAMLSRFLKSQEHRQALLAVNTKEEAFVYLKTHFAPFCEEERLKG